VAADGSEVLWFRSYDGFVSPQRFREKASCHRDIGETERRRWPSGMGPGRRKFDEPSEPMRSQWHLHIWLPALPAALGLPGASLA
ncbi:MAG: hypothetical protein VCE43_16075, partial [Myxococcota bacterium]